MRNTVTVGEHEFNLAFDFNAIARVQIETGFDLTANMTDLSPVRIRAALYAALLTHHPEITLEETGKLIHPGNLIHVMNAVNRLWFEPEGDGD